MTKNLLLLFIVLFLSFGCTTNGLFASPELQEAEIKLEKIASNFEGFLKEGALQVFKSPPNFVHDSTLYFVEKYTYAKPVIKKVSKTNPIEGNIKLFYYLMENRSCGNTTVKTGSMYFRTIGDALNTKDDISCFKPPAYRSANDVFGAVLHLKYSELNWKPVKMEVLLTQEGDHKGLPSFGNLSNIYQIPEVLIDPDFGYEEPVNSENFLSEQESPEAYAINKKWLDLLNP